ncbi:MAG: undecaprenyl-phosphate glucose phosphotransferase [Calditrichaeota bacterium]|nr:undecaprenyl-phosphate glucose phosphotransferase [Calditrichota bacterium]MBT7616101.1 undecaprenyl-phosphate glucose phosphotransferase [Calditrichota bacterium]MBT7787271.1 undecaprenyl-phosphate glucose phosphotransferase [Calditrichota bacterium]
MKRQGHLLLQTAALVADSSAIMIGAWLAYSVRFSESFTSYIPIVTSLPSLGLYVRLSLILSGLTIIYLISGGLYQFPRTDSLFDEVFLALKRFILSILILLAALFFFRDITFSRITITLLLLFSSSGLIISRYLGRRSREWLYKRSYAVRRAAIVGHGEQVEMILEHLSINPKFGINVVGCICGTDGETSSTRKLGAISETGDLIRANKIDTLIIAPSASEPDTLPMLLKACYGVNADFLYLPNIQPSGGRPRKVVEVGGVPLWTLKENPFEGWQGILKRCFDLVLSWFFFLLALPLMTILAIAVKVNSRGPLLYKQRRVGLDGKEFNVLKFRSMGADAESKTGAVWATAGDVRVTKVGKVLRRWSLDELPQFWNVIRGDMSLVGPRPERPEFVRQFEQKIDGYQERHRVRSGITGWAQVNKLRGDVPIEERTKFDRYYVENWSLLFDIKILVLTVKAVLVGENAY